MQFLERFAYSSCARRMMAGQGTKAPVVWRVATHDKHGQVRSVKDCSRNTSEKKSFYRAMATSTNGDKVGMPAIR
jgi:hypothetical protein